MARPPAAAAAPAAAATAAAVAAVPALRNFIDTEQNVADVVSDDQTCGERVYEFCEDGNPCGCKDQVACV
jgi:hypothetical protein